MKLSDYCMEFLTNKGIDTMFFLPGGGCMHLVDSLYKSDIKGVSLLHEQSVAIASEEYAFVGERVAAAIVTTGPGGTNAVTGILSAYTDSMPVIILSGQVKTTDLKSQFGVRTLGSQEADIVSIVKPITKYAHMVTDKNSIRYHLERAFYEATSGRPGPVLIDLPLDIQGSIIEPDSLYGYTPETSPIYLEKDMVQNVAELLNKAKRPLIIAGNGLIKCKDKFYKLIEELSIPVIPTWKAADILENSHPLYIGRCGSLGERAANFAMQASDLILSLGSRLDFSVTSYNVNAWAADAVKIAVDIDDSELFKLSTYVNIRIKSDVCVFMDELLELNPKTGNLTNWKERISAWKDKYPVITKEHFDSDKDISTYAVVDCLSKALSEDAIIVPASAGTVAEIFYQAFVVKRGQKVRSNHGLGAMGYELPSAIGAYYAALKPTYVVAGDGGIMLNIQELAVIAGRKLPIKIIIINNSGYSSIKNMQRNHFNGRILGANEESGLYLPDFKMLATSMGIASGRIESLNELEAGIQELINSEGPYLCDIKIDPDCIVSPRLQSKVLADGRIVSSDLSDMFPFLPKEVIREELDFDRQ